MIPFVDIPANVPMKSVLYVEKHIIEVTTDIWKKEKQQHQVVDEVRKGEGNSVYEKLPLECEVKVIVWLRKCWDNILNIKTFKD